MLAANLTNFLGGNERALVGHQDAGADAPVSFEQVLADFANSIASEHASESLRTGKVGEQNDFNQQEIELPVGGTVLFSGETIVPIAAKSQSSINARADLTSDLTVTANEHLAVAVSPNFVVGSSTKTQPEDAQPAVGKLAPVSLLNSKPVAPGNQQVLTPSLLEDASQTLVAAQRSLGTDGSSIQLTSDESIPATKSEQSPSRQLSADLQHQQLPHDAANETGTADQVQATVSQPAPALSRETANERNSVSRDRVAPVRYRVEVESGPSVETKPLNAKSQVDGTLDLGAQLAYRSSESPIESVGIDASDVAIRAESTVAHNAPGSKLHNAAGAESVEVKTFQIHRGSEYQQLDRSGTDVSIPVDASGEAVDGESKQAAFPLAGSDLRPVEADQTELVEADSDETTDNVDPMIQEQSSTSAGGFDTTGQESGPPLFPPEFSGSENDAQATRDQSAPSFASQATPESSAPGVSPVSTNATIETVPTHVALQSRDSISRPMDVTEQVASAVTQVMESADGSLVKTVELDLHPAELGRLKIKVEQTAESIATHIIATELLSSDLLASKKDALLEALSDLGFGEASVDISHQENEQSDAQPNAQRGGLGKTTTTNASESSNEAVNVYTSNGLNIVV